MDSSESKQRFCLHCQRRKHQMFFNIKQYHPESCTKDIDYILCSYKNTKNTFPDVRIKVANLSQRRLLFYIPLRKTYKMCSNFINTTFRIFTTFQYKLPTLNLLASS